MNKHEIGVSLGRFNPVMHKGHQRVVETMLENHGEDQSLIMIGSSNKFEARNPLTYPQRRHIAEVLFPDVEIMPLPDQTEGESDFETTMQAWQQSLKDEAVKREVDFKFYGGSEADVAYIKDDFAAENLGRTDVLPFSGTEVRAALETSDISALAEMVDERVVGLMQSYYQFQVAQLVNPVKPFGPFHLNARCSKPELYPERAEVKDEAIFWEKEILDYRPQYFLAPPVLNNDRTKFLNKDLQANPHIGWAHPEDWTQADITRPSFHGRIRFSDDGRPLNPMGRTGLEGRGLLGKWGVNLAVDNLVTRRNAETDVLELLIIQRPSGEWGFPGGFVDDGESILVALARELMEETNLKVDMNRSELVYQGYVDSSRNTDNAWVETEARHLHLPSDCNQTAQASNEVLDTDWLNLDDPSWPDRLLNTHAHIVNAWLQNHNS